MEPGGRLGLERVDLPGGASRTRALGDEGGVDADHLAVRHHQPRVARKLERGRLQAGLGLGLG